MKTTESLVHRPFTGFLEGFHDNRYLVLLYNRRMRANPIALVNTQRTYNASAAINNNPGNAETRNPMATTIRDVARAASVSIGTVSRALKNQPGLSETTRERAVEAARQLGYDAAQLRTRILRVTFLLHRQHNNFPVSPFFSHVLHGFEEACREQRLVPAGLTDGPTREPAQQIRPHAARA